MSASNSLLIQPIAAEETRMLRWEILRPGRPFEETRFDADDLAATLHLGAYLEGQLVSVASVTPQRCPADPQAGDWQLRGMATVRQLQGRGYGTQVLGECLRVAGERGALRVWCNGRTGALRFYERLGFRRVGACFEHPVSGPHYLLLRDL